MIPLPDKKYDIIYADPPWKYYVVTKDSNIEWNHSAELLYDVMTVDEIKELPVKSLSKKNCMLFLWCTFPCLQEGLDVIRSWGFKYKTLGFCWIKQSNGSCIPRQDGMGYYTRSNAEICLIGVKGKSLVRRHDIPSTITTPKTPHSKKPDEARKRIIELCGDLPRIELFARTKIHGWDVWGNDEKLNHEPLEAFSTLGDKRN